MDIKNRYTGEIILSIDRLQKANLIGLDLRFADLSDANLAGANLGGAYLSGANLAGANLAGADLAGANLADDYIARANLTRANLARADLARADLTKANLARADLTGAYLTRADLADTNLARADLTGADLRLAIGNMREVRSMQVDRWRVVWWMSADALMLAIGCQMHPAERWWDFTDERIAAMDREALSWWHKWKAPLRLIITELAPATPSQRAK